MTTLDDVVDRVTGQEATALATGLQEVRDAIRALAAVAHQPTSLSSIELGQTAKGATQVTVKIYGSDTAAAAVEALRLYDELTDRYRQDVPA